MLYLENYMNWKIVRYTKIKGIIYKSYSRMITTAIVKFMTQGA